MILYSFRFVFILTFLAILFASNGFYVYFKSTLNPAEVYVTQYSLAFFNAALTYGVFPLSVRRCADALALDKSSRVIILAFVTITLVVYVPIIVTMMFDDLCFRQLIFPPEKIYSYYDSQYCSEFQDTYRFRCMNSSSFPESLSFQQPFIYSYQCRNAVLKNFVPVIIFGCLIASLLLPGFYALAICLKFDKLFTTFPASVLYPSQLTLVRKDDYIVSVMTDIAMLLVFGLLSPPVAFALCFKIVCETQYIRIIIGRCLAFHFVKINNVRADASTEMKGEELQLVNQFARRIKNLSALSQQTTSQSGNTSTTELVDIQWSDSHETTSSPRESRPAVADELPESLPEVLSGVVSFRASALGRDEGAETEAKAIEPEELPVYMRQHRYFNDNFQLKHSYSILREHYSKQVLTCAQY